MPEKKIIERPRIAAVMGHANLTQDLWRHAQRYLGRAGRCMFARFNQLPDPAHLANWRPDGVLIHGDNREKLDQALALGVPVVNTSGFFDDLPVPSVLPDNVGTGVLAGEHLLSKGHRRCAFVGRLSGAYARQRLAGFQQAVAAGRGEVRVYEGTVSGLGAVVSREKRSDDVLKEEARMTAEEGLPAMRASTGGCEPASVAAP